MKKYFFKLDKANKTKAFQTAAYIFCLDCQNKLGRNSERAHPSFRQRNLKSF